MSEAWVLLFWFVLGNAATSETIPFASEDACRAAIAEIYSTLSQEYRDGDHPKPLGVNAVCLRTDAPDPNAGKVTLDEMNRALREQAAGQE